MTTITQSRSITGNFNSGAKTQTLVIFDSRLADLEVLYRSLAPDTIGYTLCANADAIPAITQLLSETGARSLALVAHGSPGVVQLGANPIDSDALALHRGLLQEWGVSEIALYSCEVGADNDFVARLGALTGAIVAASVMMVGSATKGGSWDLNLATSIVFQPQLLAAYAHMLRVVDYDSNISITSNRDSFKVGETATLTFTFTGVLAIAKFNVEDITVTGGSLSELTITGNPKVYTATFTPTVTNNLIGGILIEAEKLLFLGQSASYVTNPQSNTLSITGDTLAPTAPAAPDLQAASDSGSSDTDNLTNTKKPTLDVSLADTGAVIGDTVALYNGTNTIGAITLDSTHISVGKVAIDLTTELTEGNK